MQYRTVYRVAIKCYKYLCQIREKTTKDRSQTLTVDLVAFRHEDETDTEYLRGLPRTEQFGDRKFPHPDTYHHAVAAETRANRAREAASEAEVQAASLEV